MDTAQAVRACCCVVLACMGAAVAAGPVGSARSAGLASGLASGLHRRLDGAGFLSPQEDDFFADYKDLVTPPKDLLETPKDLLDTPKDLVDTPEDLVDTPKDLTDTPKDLLDDHQSEDFEAYAQHGSQGADAQEDVDSTHPSDDGDTAAHDELADLSLAKHLKESDRLNDQDDPGKASASLEATPSPYEQSPFSKPLSSDFQAPPFHGGPASLKSAVRPVVQVKASSYHGHSAPFRTSQYGSSEHGGLREPHAERAVRPEYAYRYGVHDPTTRDVKSAWEQRDGEDTRGGYSLVEPNGHTRVVEYSVTKHGGFNAKVKHLPPGHHGR